MRLLAMSINHHRASVDIREKLSFANGELESALAAMHRQWSDCECAVLSTCKRIELYTALTSHHAPAFEELREYLAQRCGITKTALTQASLSLEQEAAVRHLFRVGAGLDSMVLGEPQILGQIKRAYELADQ